VRAFQQFLCVRVPPHPPVHALLVALRYSPSDRGQGSIGFGIDTYCTGRAFVLSRLIERVADPPSGTGNRWNETVSEHSSNPDRAFPRRRVIKGGTIAFNLRRLTYPCVVRDLSVAGARLQVDCADSIANTFDLLIELDGFESECEIVWREGNQVGVRFLAEPRISEPKRKQVVVSPDKAPLASVRLAERTRGDFRPSPTGDPISAPQPYRPMADPASPVAMADAPLNSANPILITEEDPAVRALFQDAFRQDSVSPPFDFVEDGRELRQYLAGEDRFAGKPRPGMILLDFDMPRLDGLAALRHIKTTPSLQSIPVVVMTKSNSDEEIEETYGFGVGSYVQKPETMDDMVDVTRTLSRFWTNFVADREGAADMRRTG